jgi:hypothetical protein
MVRRVVSRLLLLAALVAVGVFVERARASDEYLFTSSPINDFTVGTNGALVIDLNQGGPRQRWTLTGNITINAINGARAGLSYDLWLRQDATGSRTVAWPSNIKWAGGSAPTISATALYQDKVTLVWDPASTAWLASVTAAYR